MSSKGSSGVPVEIEIGGEPQQGRRGVRHDAGPGGPQGVEAGQPNVLDHHLHADARALLGAGLDVLGRIRPVEPLETGVNGAEHDGDGRQHQHHLDHRKPRRPREPRAAGRLGRSRLHTPPPFVFDETTTLPGLPRRFHCTVTVTRRASVPSVSMVQLRV